MSKGNSVISKAYGRANARFIAGIILLVLAAGLAIGGFVNFQNAKKNMKDLSEIIYSTDSSKTSRLAYADIGDFFMFASKGDDLGYYIAYNSEDFYIVSMSDSAYADSVRLYNNRGSNGLFRVYGVTASIPSEAKKYAIEALNEEAGEQIVSFGNFDQVFGDACLSVYEESKVFGLTGFYEVSAMYVVLGGFALLFGLILFFIGRSQRKSFSAVLGGDSLAGNKIMEEIEKENTVWMKDMKIYLTDDYLVSVSGSIDPVKYSDIFWIYPTVHRTNGIQDYNYLNVVTKDGRTITCANGAAGLKKKRAATEEAHQTIMKTAAEKNPGVRLGYDDDNLAAYNQLRDEIKNSRKTGIE